MLQNIKECNKHAIKAGLAEQLDPQILMYWIAHHFCRLIQRLKKERPAAGREDILWNILDRWGFPIVPWKAHSLKASLCKLDHGLAMLLGLKPTNGEPFDPLVHIDLEGCTVTIDTWATNKTMYNYSTMDWDSIRKLISKVPLSHSYWDVGPTLGDEMWMGEWDRTIKPVAPPSPAFRMSLVPIDPWLSGAHDSTVFKCLDCPENFKTAGLLLRHCHQQHNSEGLASQESQDSDGVAEQYWGLKCHECGKTFSSHQGIRQHLASGAHTDSPKYKCPKCDRIFDALMWLTDHMVTHTDERPYKCHICGACFKSDKRLKNHMKVHSDNRPRYECADCGKSYTSAGALKEHEEVVHGGKKFPCEKCGKVFFSGKGLRKHIRNVHGEQREEHQCPKCSKKFLNKGDLAVHLKEVHGEQRKFPCDKCDSVLSSPSSLRNHVRYAHGDKDWTCPHCGERLGSESSLAQHKKKMHSS